ncbi:MAG: YceI family protein [Candidatus Acidiferrales bacterium]
MIRLLTAMILPGVLAFATVAPPVPERVIVVEKQNSKIEFHASATFAKVTGVFQKWDASFKLGSDNLENSSLALQIEAASVHTGSGFKDKEVKGKNFFNVNEYPEIKFVSDGVLADPDPQKFTMTGNLTLRGITRPVTVAIETAVAPNGAHKVNGTFTFNRRDFGMTHNVPFNKVADIITVNIALELPSDALPAAKAAPAEQPST